METTTVTDISRQDIVARIEENFNRAQATGLNCLIFLSLREQSTVAYQWDEWGFTDIPQQVIAWCDQLKEHELLLLTTDIAVGLVKKIIADGFEEELTISANESLAI
jgi:hypothetical protein